MPERIPATGLIILNDAKPCEPEVTLSPLTYFYQHRAELEVVIQAGTGRDELFAALTVSIGAALAADRTSGGLCDWVEAEAPEPGDLPIEGAAALKAAVNIFFFSRRFSSSSDFIWLIIPRHGHSDQWRSHGSTSIPPYFARHL